MMVVGRIEAVVTSSPVSQPVGWRGASYVDRADETCTIGQLIMPKTLTSLGIVFLLVSFLPWLGCSKSVHQSGTPQPTETTSVEANRPSDEELYDMVQARVDLSRPVELSFSLTFRTEAEAKAAASDIDATFTTDVGRAGLSADSGWTVSASQKTMLTLAHVQEVRKSFKALAQAHNGRYEGWAVMLGP